MAWIRMRPARHRLDAVEPGADVFVLRGNVKAELVGRVVKIAGHGNIGDGRLGAQQVGVARESLVDDRERAESAAFEEVHDNRVAERLGEVAQKVQPIVLAARQEFARASSEIFQASARLGELLFAVNEHWSLDHFVYRLT